MLVVSPVVRCSESVRSRAASSKLSEKVRKWSAKDLGAKERRHVQMLRLGPMMNRKDSYWSGMCNGQALGDAEDGKTVTIRARRCSILYLQKAKVQVCMVAVKMEATLPLATRSTLRAYMCDELAFVTVCLSRMPRM